MDNQQPRGGSSTAAVKASPVLRAWCLPSRLAGFIDRSDMLQHFLAGLTPGLDVELLLTARQTHVCHAATCS